MKNIRTYKRKLNLTIMQEKRLRNWIGACRVVYNLGLEIKNETYAKTGKSAHKYELINQITGLRSDINWIKDVPFCALTNSILRLDKTFQNFFRNNKTGVGYPKFLSKKFHNSITVNENVRVIGNSINIPKIGILKIVKDASINGTVKNITIKIEPTGLFAYLVCSVDPALVSKEGRAIGVDMGISNFVITSEGQFIDNPRHFKKYERRIRIESRSLSRKNKFSKSWKKQSKRLTRLHHKIANVRKDFLHKQSTQIANEYGKVYIEDINIKGMSKNSNLSKHILDAGWGMFRTMLEYKTNVVSVNPAYTSQMCHQCKTVDKLSRISQSEFVCTNCGNIAHADINAAKNIKHQGMMLERKREALACA